MSSNEAPPQGDPLAQLETLFAQGMAGGLPEAQEPIGGFFAGPAGPISTSGQFIGPYVQQHPNAIANSYNEGDDFAVLQGMNTEQLARFQDTLVANGIIREVVPGRIDDNTIKGMGTLMALGNRQSVDWKTVLEGITRAGGFSGGSGGGADTPEFDPDPYLVPDPASIAQEIKSLVRDRLGRDPDQGEMAQLTSEWMGWDKQAYNAQTEAQRAQFDARTTPGTQDPTTVQQIDPAARFAEAFERKYANELEFVEDKDDARESRAVVESGASTLSQMSRGA